MTDKTPKHGIEVTVMMFYGGEPTPYRIVAASKSVQRNEGKPAFAAYRNSDLIGAFLTYDEARAAIDAHPMAYA